MIALCPPNSCLQPAAGLEVGSIGTPANFFVCRQNKTGALQSASVWTQNLGTDVLAGFLSAGFHTHMCTATQPTEPPFDCSLCSWPIPDAYASPTVVAGCHACLQRPA